MAFKSMDQYVEKKYENLFTLQNDKDYADVIFMYRSTADVMIARAHYITSSQYSGYVQCLETPDCPACTYVTSRGNHLDVRDKLFIPMYVITYSTGRKAREIQFWDRNMTFQPVLASQVFNNYPNPSEYIFRITRNGAYRDVNTTYDIQVLGVNTLASYDQICKDYNAVFPQYFNTICKDVSKTEMTAMLNSSNTTETTTTSYTADQYNAIPRVDANSGTPQPSPIVQVPNYAANAYQAPGDDGVPAKIEQPPVSEIPNGNDGEESSEELNAEDINF